MRAYWSYLGIGGLAMLVVTLIAGQMALAALSAVGLLLAMWQLVKRRRHPDD